MNVSVHVIRKSYKYMFCVGRRSLGLTTLLHRNSIFASRRFFGSAQHGNGSSHGDAPAKIIYPEEYTQIARNWPKEQLEPDQYEDAFSTGPQVHLESGHASEMPDGSDIHTKEDFSSPFWTKLMGSAVFLAVLIRVNDWMFGDLTVHPFKQFMDMFKEDSVKAQADEQKWLDIYKRQAEDTLILKDYSNRDDHTIHRLRCPDLVHRCSDWSVVPGTQVDFSDVKFKHSWQEDDKYFGVPYPKE